MSAPRLSAERLGRAWFQARMKLEAADGATHCPSWTDLTEKQRAEWIRHGRITLEILAADDALRALEVGVNTNPAPRKTLVELFGTHWDSVRLARLREADVLERHYAQLRGRARHDDDCEHDYQSRVCTCGLDALLKEGT